MENVMEWINKYYPADGTCIREEDKENYGKTRAQITNLDISNQNLTGMLAQGNAGFTNLKKINLSFNDIKGHFLGDIRNTLEEVDYSHNPVPGFGIIGTAAYYLKKLNISGTGALGFHIDAAPRLTDLDVSKNSFKSLDLENLTELKVLDCSGNNNNRGGCLDTLTHPSGTKLTNCYTCPYRIPGSEIAKIAAGSAGSVAATLVGALLLWLFREKMLVWVKKCCGKRSTNNQVNENIEIEERMG